MMFHHASHLNQYINDQVINFKCSTGKVCSHSSSEKRQAQRLLDFSNEFFMEQYIKKPTRNKNILDLCFTNDQFLIHNYQVIVNSQLSDHFTICINLNYEKVKKKEIKKKSNQYRTTVPEYDLMAGDEEDWLRMDMIFRNVNWESLLENLSPTEALSKLLNVIEEKIPLVFNKHSDFLEKESNHPSSRFSSNNKIPKKIRILMRNKSTISKAMLRPSLSQDVLT